MPRADRASQFMPFAALKVFEEALKEQERVIVPKAQLSEDVLDILDYQLSILKPGTMVDIIYYDHDNYVKKHGLVSKINKDGRFLTVVTTDISFDDIRKISF